MSLEPTMFVQSLFHGTKADLQIGDLLTAGQQSNFTNEKTLSWVYCSATLDAAIWGAELASGIARGRIYVVEATGSLEDDPNVTDKKFPGNPTMSFRSREPLRVVAEVVNWKGHSSERIREMREGLARLQAAGAEIID